MAARPVNSIRALLLLACREQIIVCTAIAEKFVFANLLVVQKKPESSLYELRVLRRVVFLQLWLHLVYDESSYSLL